MPRVLLNIIILKGIVQINYIRKPATLVLVSISKQGMAIHLIDIAGLTVQVDRYIAALNLCMYMRELV